MIYMKMTITIKKNCSKYSQKITTTEIYTTALGIMIMRLNLTYNLDFRIGIERTRVMD